MKARKILFLPLILFSLLLSVRAEAGTALKDLRVEHRTEPLTLEELHPSFSWKMESSEKGQRQTAYRIRVRRESDGRQVWDSGEVLDSLSTGIRYLGMALQPGMGYDWDLTVTDKAGRTHSASSRFEMGLMDPRQSAWRGAEWIGNTRPCLDAASLHRFSISSDFIIVKGKTAGFILGADDFRLKDIFQNSWNLAGDNYFKVVLDFSGYGTAAGSGLHVYRVGYAPEDTPSKPLLTISKTTYPDTNLDRILKGGPGDEHHFKLIVQDGAFAFEIDRQALATEADGKPARFTVSPAGAGPDVNTFPHLCSIGFVADPGSDVTYTGYRIDAGRQGKGGPLFAGAGQYRRFEGLSCIRLPRYRNQNAYENDIVVINKGEQEVIETIDPSYGGAKLLRREFSTASGKKVRKAKLYASALGVCDFYLNGQRVGDDWFAPGESRYPERVTYRAYDVTPLVRSGQNAIGAELSDAWYGDGAPALLCRLDLIYEDGTTERIVSHPEKWKSSDSGPVRVASFSQGERFDAGREDAVKGWSEPGFDDSRWHAAEPVRASSRFSPYITARADEPVRVRETLTAVERMTAHSDDYHTHIYDMGTDMVGVPELHVPAGWLNKGDVVVIRYAGQLFPEKEGSVVAGHMAFEGNRSAMAADFHIAAGNGETVIRPRSTWHRYRYIQVTLPSHEGPLPLENVKGLVLSSCPLPTGSYEAVTADGETGEWAGQLFSEIRRGQLGDLFPLPSDASGQDESKHILAYLGTAGYNADVLGFFRQWMTDLRDSKAGDEAGGKEDCAEVCMVPWEMFRQYGDTRIVEENLEPMMNVLNEMASYSLSAEFPHLTSQTDLAGNAAYVRMLGYASRMADAAGQDGFARVLRERYRLAGMEWDRAKERLTPSVATPGALPELSLSGRWKEAYDLFASMDAADPSDFGALGQWMYEYQLGISPGEDAGYKHFVLQPVAGGDYRSLKGSFESEYGQICSAWLADGAGRMTAYTAEVPANSSATLYLPVGEEVQEFKANEWARFQGTELHNGVLTAIYELSSGRHAFLIGEKQITVE